MAKRDIQFLQGHYYHIYNRGAARISIFHNDDDYTKVLFSLKEYVATLKIAIIAYCLMPNHYHWLVRQDGVAPARLLPQRVFNSYVKSFNGKYERSGTLFEGTFKCIPVENDEYLRHLCRYIHSNPVKDNMAAAPQLWDYSNYREWIGTRDGSLVDHNFIRTHFGDGQTYQRFVIDYLTGRQQLSENVRQFLAGLS